MRYIRAQWAVLGIAAIPALVGVAMLAMRGDSASTAPVAAPAVEPPPIVAATLVCSFVNDDARAAMIAGADGGQSVVVDGVTHWLFGDTIFDAASGKQIEANSIATSGERAPGSCPRLDYVAREAVAQPFLEKDGSLTVWPSGAIANDDGAFDVFTVYIYGSGPYAYWIGEIGVARVDPATMRVDVTARRLFDDTNGFSSQVIGAQPIDRDSEGRTRVVLQTLDDQKLLARVSGGALHDRDAYEYWTGNGWSPAPASAVPLWPTSKPDDPVQRLVAYEGGVQISYSDTLDAYVAVMNAGHASMGVRVAAQLEGPWSDIVPWLDCSTFAEPRVPVCYAPSVHPQFSDDGSLFVTLTRFGEYDVVAYELTPGVAVHEYRNGEQLTYALKSPGDGWEDLGVPFYAAAQPVEGLSPIYEWSRNGQRSLAAATPGEGYVRGQPAFYAQLTPPPESAPVTLRAVYEWRDGDAQVLSTMTSGLELYGLERGAIAFYAARP